MKYREQQEFLEEKLLSHRAKKSSESKRWIPDDKDDYRTEYQRDIGRILYSDAFRRLSHKTQVFLTNDLDQHSRTRMSHTLEVNQIAKSIARPLGYNEDLVEAIALGHDLGHTPYGHAGEKILDKKLKLIGKSFNHNVQSVWIVQKILYNRKDANGNFIPGLNLTYDVVEGLWKHTNIENQVNEFQESLSKLQPDTIGSIEAQIVNKSDSIAYMFHDIKDAVRNKIITIQEFENDVWKKYFDSKFNQENWINLFIYDLLSNNKDSECILFSEQFEKGYMGIRNFLYERVIKSEAIQSVDKECEEKISTIYDYYINNVEILLNKNKVNNQYKLEYHGKERVVVDYIQWLGDANANLEYEKITKKGSSIG